MSSQWDDERLTVLRNIIDNIPYAVWWKDRESVFLGCNEEFARATGSSDPADIVGKTDLEIWDDVEQAEFFRRIDREVMTTKQALLELEEPLLRPDGTPSVLLTSKVPLYDHEGDVRGILGIYTDITERKQIERALRRAKEQAEAAIRTQSDFLANVSHELRTPLTLIMGSVDALHTHLEQQPVLSRSETKPQLDRIRRNSLRLLHQVNDILQLSALEDGSPRRDRQVVDLGELMTALVDDADPLARRRDLELSMSTTGTTTVRADPSMLETIGLNLLSNALKFTPPGGSVHVGVTGREAHVELSIQDTGPGIPRSLHETIFERFRQVDASSTRRYAGTGIGLALVRELAALHDAEYGVESEVGQGSRFWLRFPMVLAEPSERVPAPRGAARASWILDEPERARPQRRGPPGAPRVLVVDDNEELLEYIATLLERDYRVETANDGEEALKLAKARPPEVVVSDLMMPKLDGRQLVAAFAADSSLRHVPVILVTARAEPTLVTESLNDGAHDYLCKPFHAEELRARVRAAHRMSQASQQLVLNDRLAILGTLAAGAAHEINNPLMAISSNLSFAQQELEAEVGTKPWAAEVVGALAEALQGTTQVAQVVRDLGAFSRRSRLEVDESIDLHPLLESMINLAKGELLGRAHLVRDLHEIPAVHGNGARLGQVFLNLLINAAHAFASGDPERNEVRLETRRRGSDHVVVTVTDNGRGIAPASLGRIFDPFFTTKEIGNGTGLGLWVSRRIIEQLGGEIRVQSTLGEGTTFEIVLPIARASEEGTATEGQDSSVPSRTRVLVIDDDAMLARAIGRVLRSYEVVIANGGQAGLERLKGEETYDLVLCDLMMPDLSGMGLYEQLRAEDQTKADAIVFMTGAGSHEHTRDFLQQVSNPCLLKPFTAKDIMPLLNERARARG